MCGILTLSTISYSIQDQSQYCCLYNLIQFFTDMQCRVNLDYLICFTYIRLNTPVFNLSYNALWHCIPVPVSQLLTSPSLSQASEGLLGGAAFMTLIPVYLQITCITSRYIRVGSGVQHHAHILHHLRTAFRPPGPGSVIFWVELNFGKQHYMLVSVLVTRKYYMTL